MQATVNIHWPRSTDVTVNQLGTGVLQTLCVTLAQQDAAGSVHIGDRLRPDATVQFSGATTVFYLQSQAQAEDLACGLMQAAQMIREQVMSGVFRPVCIGPVFSVDDEQAAEALGMAVYQESTVTAEGIEVGARG